MDDNQQVCWTTVLEFVQNLGVDPAATLMAGTPRWNTLPDDHPDKRAAVLAAGVHHALRIDLGQTAMAEASREISCAADWSTLARQVQTGRGGAYIPREVA